MPNPLSPTLIVDLAVAVGVGISNHLLNVLLRHLIAQCGQGLSQFRHRQETVVILAKKHIIERIGSASSTSLLERLGMNVQLAILALRNATF